MLAPILPQGFLMHFSLRTAATAFLVLASATVSQAHTTTYTAILSGPLESPANASPGIGFATVTLDLDLVTLQVELSFSGLQGTTTQAHIHAATPQVSRGPTTATTSIWLW